ncbi:fatty acyl-CoA reductase 2-like [Toxorhynchites rutilus septentrionalis]|uniref:fatty acyl-CoA reductase 2-like n=1 Tax=Toxorhynchites rutilus septentrionalis TaxID=329112 RepID=UPI002478B51F|nr:fatty acyl-CoA reductase 2-like [Toxorhynchites rutilus septentrionalis]
MSENVTIPVSVSSASEAEKPEKCENIRKQCNPNEGVEQNRILAMYKDATILITGGTGFLGKVLLEKTLRCLNVKKIFLLIRRKDGQTAQERLVKLLKDAIFEKARSSYPNEQQLFGKIEAVEIDLDSETLCQGEKFSENRLLEETEIVFNVLASVKFNESIRNALVTNVAGTRKVLLLAEHMVRLRAIVHVSTLYSNCNRPAIEEKIYDDVPLRDDMLLQLLSTMCEKEMVHFQHCFLGSMPNTYTFSKKCAEVMIQRQFSHLPIGIFRPPIVISTYKEPLAGWTDNLNGPSGLCMWTVKGFIHTIWGDASKKANLVPVDCCVNAMIVAAYDIGARYREHQEKLGLSLTSKMETALIDDKNSEHRTRGDDVGGCSGTATDGNRQLDECTSRQWSLAIYNFMYPEHSLTWGRYMEMVSLGFESRLHQMVWNYSYIITSYRPVFRVLSFCLHIVPVTLLDVVRRIRRKKPFYRKAMRKTTQFLEMMSYFGLREWTIANGNVRRLRGLLSGEEARLLEFDMATIRWSEYFRTYIPGIRRHCFEERLVRGDRWSPTFNRRFHFIQRLLQKLIWIWICVRFTRVTSKLVLKNLFAILIA